MTRSLTDKYRPTKLGQVVGQQHAVDMLKGMILNKRIPNAILFAGPSGTGKTTLARILAYYANCEVGKACGKCDSCKQIKLGTSPDVLEDNAGNARGIDDIRSIIGVSSYTPFSNYRIIILDESHSYTKQAFDAMLKPLEEPSNKTIFILCTTEPSKIPKTILTRCTRINLTPATKEDILKNLANILEKEEASLDKPLLEGIAEASNGSVRASVVLLQTVLDFTKAKKPLSEIKEYLRQGSCSEEEVASQDIYKALLKKDFDAVVSAALLSGNLVSLSKNLLRLSLFVVGLKLNITKTQHFWPMSEGFAIQKDVKAQSLEKLVFIQTVFTDLHTELMTFASPEANVFLKHLSKLWTISD